MSILAALAQSQAAKQSALDDNRIIMPDGLFSVSDAVWECTLYQYGYDLNEWRDEPVESRGQILQQLEQGQC